METPSGLVTRNACSLLCQLLEKNIIELVIKFVRLVLFSFSLESQKFEGAEKVLPLIRWLSNYGKYSFLEYISPLSLNKLPSHFNTPLLNQINLPQEK
jgi:hypothetical protein